MMYYVLLYDCTKYKKGDGLMFCRKPSKYDDLTYEELLRIVNHSEFSYGKEARKIHKALKKYNDGLSIHIRYPDFPYLLSAFAGGFSAVTVFILFASI